MIFSIPHKFRGYILLELLNATDHGSIILSCVDIKGSYLFIKSYFVAFVGKDDCISVYPLYILHGFRKLDAVKSGLESLALSKNIKQDFSVCVCV